MRIVMEEDEYCMNHEPPIHEEASIYYVLRGSKDWLRKIEVHVR